jgi:hypothetical protein
MAWIADASSDVCQEDEAVLKVLGGSFRIRVAEGDRGRTAQGLLGKQFHIAVTFR